MEIEKKFQIRNMPPQLEQFPKKEIEQGYLCVDPVVRIRRSNDRYILTYKSNMGLEDRQDAEARINQEIEAVLTCEGYEHLREKVDGHLICKTRYIIPLPDGHTGELDVFHGYLEGLTLIEVEFEDEDDARAFQAPDWFGTNVSSDKRYTNSFLSECDSLSVFNK